MDNYTLWRGKNYLDLLSCEGFVVDGLELASKLNQKSKILHLNTVS